MCHYQVRHYLMKELRCVDCTEKRRGKTELLTYNKCYPVIRVCKKFRVYYIVTITVRKLSKTCWYDSFLFILARLHH